ncbi:winged helix-turn-helix domain-containing protein [Rothia sp. P5764]|uniref:winged helix-turn-helix domain-containing protein n=1 Tax=Rothia sp. P5764 TaxID=3402654 RepID=UPI003AC4B9E3
MILWFDRAEPLAQVAPESAKLAPVVSAVAESPVRLSKNSPYIVDALGRGGELSAPELAERLGLSLAQVRYALRPLLERGDMVMVGSQGSHSTVYALKSMIG